MSRFAGELLARVAPKPAGLGGAVWQVAVSAPEGEQIGPKSICRLRSEVSRR